MQPASWLMSAAAPSRLLESVIQGLGGAHCSAASVDAALTVVEGLLEHGSPQAERVLKPHAVTLAASLRSVTLSSSAASAARTKRTQVLCHCHCLPACGEWHVQAPTAHEKNQGFSIRFAWDFLLMLLLLC